MTQTAPPETLASLLARTKPNGECLEWSGSRNSANYGLVRQQGRLTSTHRLAYALTHGVSLTSSQHVMHSCDNPPCINPRHLSAGSAASNMQDMTVKDRGGRAKLTVAQVREIRARHHSRGHGRNATSNTLALAGEYGVTVETIRFIATRRTWQTV